MASSEPTEPATGACLCGGVQYQVPPSIYNVVCHCTSCRRVTGSSFMTASIYPKEGFSITCGSELIKSYQDTSTDSGTPLTRRFCGQCGSQLYITTPLNDDIVSFPAGTLDAVKGWTPGKEQYHRNRAHWMPELEGVSRHVTHPFSEDPDMAMNLTRATGTE